MSKLFAFRFDVDTHTCVRRGMPALTELGERLQAPFTFFVNMGRAVSRSAVLARLLSRSGSAEAAKYSARAKLGRRGYLEAALLNPAVGGGAPDVIRDAHRGGHEIGLHGGRNHAAWQRGAAHWARPRLEAEVDAVLPRLVSLLDGRQPEGFASPGWTTSPRLGSVLAERGFRYQADLHGPPGSEAADSEPKGPLPMVRTHLTGEPGGVAYIEHLRALGLGDDDLLRRFESDLQRAGDTAVVYDHPCFAGVRELGIVERLIRLAREAGYEVVPLASIAGAGRW